MNGALIRRVDSRKPFIVMSMPALSSQSRMFVVTARAYTQPSRVPVMLAAASVALVGMISFSLPSLSTEKNNTANGKKRGDINSLIAQNKHNNSVQIKRTRNNCSSNNSKFEHHPRTAKEEGIFFAASMMQDKASKASPTSSPPQTVSSTATLADNPAQQTKLSVQRRRTTERMKSTKTRKSVYTIYDIEPAPLGEGSFGQVFAATNKQSGERLALKKIRKEFTDELEFQKEMNALLHIRACGGHPNICMLREHFEEDDNFILILDLIRGGDLFDHLIDHGAYSEADAARLTREVACALSFLHGIGVVHADLKPENLMLSSKNGLDAVIQVVDFGSAEVCNVVFVKNG